MHCNFSRLGFLKAVLLFAGLAASAPQLLAQGGVPLWTNRYQGPSVPDQARSIAADSSGNVFVTGISTATNGNPNYATIKYSNTGAPLWTNRYTGITNSGGLEFAVAVDGGGNVFVTGYSPGIGPPPDYATVAYSSAGVALWTNYYSAPFNLKDAPPAMCFDEFLGKSCFLLRATYKIVSFLCFG